MSDAHWGSTATAVTLPKHEQMHMGGSDALITENLLEHLPALGLSGRDKMLLSLGPSHPKSARKLDSSRGSESATWEEIASVHTDCQL